MTAAVYVPLLSSILLAVVGPALAPWLPPMRGAQLLAGASAVTGLSGAWALLLLACSLMDDLPDVLRIEPMGDWIGVAAGLALAAGMTHALIVTVSRGRLHRRLRRLCRDAGGGELVVLPDPRPHAFAVPGRPGHVVVSDSMLRALTTPQRRVLLAHERAHLQAHHSRLLVAVQTAAAINPVLTPVRVAVAFLCERWADEVAARTVGDRKLAAEALATAALATVTMARGPGHTMAFQELSVVRRVAALRSPPPPLRYWRVIISVAVLLCAAMLAADLNATAQFISLTSRLAGH